MCSMIDSGEKGYKLPEQILFNSLVLYLTLILHEFTKIKILNCCLLQNIGGAFKINTTVIQLNMH